MCGISGYISKSQQFHLKDLKAINEQLRHRGPDEDGYYQCEQVGLGHKRLSIIDLKSGQQPMKNAQETLVISYNGELYNYKDIRKSLITKGMSFQTSSDTEVILKAYEYYGNDCVKHFRGMFAFAIVNTLLKEVFIGRDHLGIKPVVYYQDADSIAWASEIQALKAVPNFIADIDYYAIDQYLKYQYIPAPRTVFRKVNKLMPGHFMVLGFNGAIKSVKQYWDLKFSPKKRTEQQWLKRLEQEVKTSVAMHTVSDVDFGAFLSGGIDSTLIVKYMTEVLGTGIKTYTIGFKEAKVNESHHAQKVADRYKTDHTSLTLEGDALEILPLLVKHYGEPFGDFSAVPTFYVSELAAKDVKMVLSGDGADEAFAGYSHYPLWLDYISEHDPKSVFKNATVAALYPLANKLHSKRYPKLNRPSDALSNYTRYRSRMQDSVREALWQAPYRYLIDLPDELDLHYADAYRNQGEFSRSQYFDIKVFMPSDILTKVDIASMINSLEVRTPLTDVAVFELAASMPPELLLEKKDGRWHGKQPLKKLLESDFAHDFIDRKKQGFEIPLEQWLFTGANFEAIKKRFQAPNGILRQLFEPLVLQQLLDEKNGFQVWLLLVLDEWFRQHG